MTAQTSVSKDHWIQFGDWREGGQVGTSYDQETKIQNKPVSDAGRDREAGKLWTSL